MIEMFDINGIKVEPKFQINLDKQKERVGILNKGKGTKIINNQFSGLDVAIQDEGENTLAQGNKIE